MFEGFLDNQNQAILLYAAMLIFVFAVMIEFWRRFNYIQTHRRENPLSDRMEKAIHYFAEDKKRLKITNDAYQKLTGISDATATRDLDKLEELGFLEQKGRNRGVYYLPTGEMRKHTKSHQKKRLIKTTSRKRTAHTKRKTAH